MKKRTLLSLSVAALAASSLVVGCGGGSSSGSSVPTASTVSGSAVKADLVGAIVTVNGDTTETGVTGGYSIVITGSATEVTVESGEFYDISTGTTITNDRLLKGKPNKEVNIFTTLLADAQTAEERVEIINFIKTIVPSFTEDSSLAELSGNAFDSAEILSKTIYNTIAKKGETPEQAANNGRLPLLALVKILASDSAENVIPANLVLNDTALKTAARTFASGVVSTVALDSFEQATIDTFDPTVAKENAAKSAFKFDVISASFSIPGTVFAQGYTVENDTVDKETRVHFTVSQGDEPKLANAEASVSATLEFGPYDTIEASKVNVPSFSAGIAVKQYRAGSEVRSASVIIPSGLVIENGTIKVSDTARAYAALASTGTTVVANSSVANDTVTLVNDTHDRLTLNFAYGSYLQRYQDSFEIVAGDTFEYKLVTTLPMTYNDTKEFYIYSKDTIENSEVSINGSLISGRIAQ